MKKRYLVPVLLLLVIGGFWELTRASRLEMPTIQRREAKNTARTNDVNSGPAKPESSSAPKPSLTSAASSSNAAAEKMEMLAEVNKFLAKSPLYGLPKQLTPESVLVTNFHEMVWLHTTNLSHRFRRQYGVIWEAYALKDDLKAVIRHPEQRKTWGTATERWNKESATNSFFARLQAEGITGADLGTNAQLVYHENRLDFWDNGKRKDVYPFYDVGLVDRNLTAIVKARYRRDETNGWVLSYWMNNLRK
jgi:hypothetical protein